MNFSKNIYFVLLLVLSLVPSVVYADTILDKVEIIQAKTESEIHIEFLTQVRYMRHSPTKESARVQIFLDFPQYSNTKLPTTREFRNVLSTNQVPSFTVNYPEQQTSSIGIRFKKAVKFTITPDNSGRGIVIHVPYDKNLTPAVSVIDTPVKVEVPVEPVIEHGPQGELPVRSEGMSDNDYAGKLVIQSKTARANGDYPYAVLLLNAALNLPANSHSQEAQELIGNSREKMGDTVKAKSEYETYIKLYPQGEAADRIRQRLAALNRTSQAKVSGPSVVQKGKKPISEIHENTVSGSWNQYYYDAHSHNYPGTGVASTHHDQSQLISSLDLTARFRQNEWDSKIVFRNTQTMNFLPKGEDRDRTQAAYVEVNNKESDYLARIGRQNGNSGGVLGRFDGALFRYGFSPKLKLNFVAGTLDEYKVDYRRHFYGINLDVGPVFENWSGNAYFIEQKVDHLIDRRAVGGELRYFNGGKSVYSLVDYDTYYNRLNTIMVQGNWATADGSNFNMLAEHRKSPTLQLINSLSDPAFNNQSIYTVRPSSIRQALQEGGVNASESILRGYAINQALDTSLVMFGATRQFTPRWQLGGDVQMSRVTGSDGASAGAIALAEKIAADAGTFLSDLDRQNLKMSFAGGNTYTYHVQAVGTDTLFKDDTSVISASLTTGPTSLVQSLVLTNVMVPREKWRLDSSLKFLKIDSDPSSVQYIFSPTMRASYRLRDKATIEAEVGVEVTNDNTLGNGHTRTFRDYSFIGYRLDI